MIIAFAVLHDATPLMINPSTVEMDDAVVELMRMDYKARCHHVTGSRVGMYFVHDSFGVLHYTIPLTKSVD